MFVASSVFAINESITVFLGDSAKAGHMLDSSAVYKEPIILTVGLTVHLVVPVGQILPVHVIY
jgi:hypothetical protein